MTQPGTTAQYVLLTHEDGHILVACPDEATAESVGAAAIFNDGGVSAWPVPTMAVTDHERVKEILRAGGDISDIFAAELPVARANLSGDGQ